MSVSKQARQHGINANMLFEWQRDLRGGLFSASGSQATHLLPIELYLIQAEIRGKPPDERRSVRQARARCPTTWGSGCAPRSKSSRKFDTSGAHPVLTRPEPVALTAALL
ncbi:MAG: transposase [Pseudomonadota bacterium]|nr:transposase [Pseudomonadota bacterium]